METTSIGELVRVSAGGPALDGVVFDMPSRSKVVVAVVDPSPGPLLRTVTLNQLTAREEEGPDDRTLRLLIQRTPRPVTGAARGALGGGHSRSGFKRGSAHRPTGR
jgi:hypothetical protein